MKVKKEYDWAGAKAAYITGTEGYRKVAKRFGIPLGTFSDHARKEGWKQEQEAKANEIADKTIQKTVEKISDKQSDLLSLQADSALRIAQQINDYLTSGYKWKPFDLLRITNCWQILQDNLDKKQEITEETTGGLCFIPERTTK